MKLRHLLVLLCSSSTLVSTGQAVKKQLAPAGRSTPATTERRTPVTTDRSAVQNRLALRWSFVQNLYGPTPRAVSLLTIVNKGTLPFPAAGWKIYFNGNRAVDPASMAGNLRIRHINGDLFCLEPPEGGSGRPLFIQPGDSLQVRYICSDLSINISDAPVGFYLVWDRHPAIGYALPDYTVGRIGDEKLERPTSAMEFARNAGTTDIPLAALPRIFPSPVYYREDKDSGRLETGTRVLTDPAFSQEARYLAEALGPILGQRPAVSIGPAPSINSAQALPIKKTHTPIILRKAQMGASAYELSVHRDSIVILAAAPEGAFHGIQSLLTAIDPAAWKARTTGPANKPGQAGAIRKTGAVRTANKTGQPGAADKTERAAADNAKGAILLPGMEVRDSPRFAYRGFMLDVARHFRSPRELCRVLDLMALYKMNVLHLHFSDDEGWRLEIPSLPELTAVGGRRGYTMAGGSFLPASFGSGPEPGRYPGSGYYTRADFIKVLRYAWARHIEVIPELESPGHARAAIKAMDARYERYKRQGNYTEAVRYLLRDTLDRSVYEGAQLWHDNVLCVALPSVYRFMDKVTGEILQMYKAAGAPLTSIHLGGDEVPAGAWERSPACLKLAQGDPVVDGQRGGTDPMAGGKPMAKASLSGGKPAGADPVNPGTPMDTATSTRFRAYCWAFFYNRLDSLLTRKGLLLSGWEEVATLGNKHMHIHVWDNMIGAGNEDRPYRLANAGYPVILSCVSNNYYDLACDPSFEEKGYHWGGFLGMDKPFAFIPYDYYKNSVTDYMGKPVRPGYFSEKEKLTAEGRSHILGIEGLLWGETLPTDDRLEYMLLPRLLGTAERAWAVDPAWATETDSVQASQQYAAAWNVFANVLGKRELPRLSYLNGGYAYRIPVAGTVRAQGQLMMNGPFPGFTIRYTTDGSEPETRSQPYTGPVEARGTIKIKVFDPAGRGGRTVTIENERL